MFRRTDQETKVRAGWKGLRCTIQIFPLISQINWCCWLQQPFPSFSVNVEQMVAFWQLKKKIFQTVSLILGNLCVAVHKKLNRSVEFVSHFNGLCPLQTGRFDICVKAALADPGFVIYLFNCPKT